MDFYALKEIRCLLRVCIFARSIDHRRFHPARARFRPEPSRRRAESCNREFRYEVVKRPVCNSFTDCFQPTSAGPLFSLSLSLIFSFVFSRELLFNLPIFLLNILNFLPLSRVLPLVSLSTPHHPLFYSQPRLISIISRHPHFNGIWLPRCFNLFPFAASLCSPFLLFLSFCSCSFFLLARCYLFTVSYCLIPSSLCRGPFNIYIFNCIL